jgi:predicted nuclease of restriction endonuclease-like (RecB) superfamily
MKMTKLEKNIQLFGKVAELIESARKKVATAVNLTMVYTYFEIGRMIVEDEQSGKERAEYGKTVLKDLSKQLTEKFGKGFSIDNLEKMRQFYSFYSISETVSRKLEISSRFLTIKKRLIKDENKLTLQKNSHNFILSWSHYLVLMRIENPAERSFYEIECAENNWSLRDLKRQYNSSLYERLALSRNKEDVMKLSTHGHTIQKPEDILKNPLTLEFLGLEEKSKYSETDLEDGIISKLQAFLLEIGKGFLFQARQKRFTFDDKHFFVDLVLYNRLLQCYVLIDLKTDELVHQDLGQMQMYVNYYDRYEKKDFEKPSIGILLCKKKQDTLVELTLPKDANIYASEYSLYLPEKELLQQKLNEWLLEFETIKSIKKFKGTK